MYPELQNATQRLQVDLLLRPANLTDLEMTWHGALAQGSQTLNWPPYTAPLQVNLAVQAKALDQDPGTTQPEANLGPLTYKRNAILSRTHSTKNKLCRDLSRQMFKNFVGNRPV